MGLWDTLKKAADFYIEASNPNTHYQNGYDHGISGGARIQFPVMGNGPKSALTVA